MRRAVLVALTALVLLPAASAAGPAFEAHINVSTSAVDVGLPVSIALRTYWVDHDRGARILADGPGRRLRVEAVAPAGGASRVPLHHASRGVWRGTAFPLRVAGRFASRTGRVAAVDRTCS
jgi:hypothetical protein